MTTLDLSATKFLMDRLQGEPDRSWASEDEAEMGRRALAAARAPRLKRLVPGVLRHWLTGRAERRAMAEAVERLERLSPHLLDDIGLTEREEPAEAARLAIIRPFVAPRQVETRPAMPEGFRIAAE